MAGEMDMNQSEQIPPAAIHDSSMKLSEKDMGKDRVQLDSDTSASSGVKGGMDQSLAFEQGGYCPQTSCYDYYYPGYDGTFTQSDDKGYFNSTGCPYPAIQSDNSSLLYCVPGYGPYATGFVGVDGKQTFPPSEYLQQPSPYGSDSFSSYSYDSSYAGNGSSGHAARPGPVPSFKEPSGSGNLNGLSHAKTNNYPNRTSPSHFNSRVQQPASNFSRSTYQNYPLKPMDKMGSGYQSAGLMKGFHPTGKYSQFMDGNASGNRQQGSVNYHYNGREWSNNNYRQTSRENFGRGGEFEYATELTRGPRGDNNRNNSMKLSAEVKPVPAIEKSLYNLQEFQTEYDNAKFFVIKSYSEDDIHKCIKYGVWSSTPNGNKKLDAAFREADAKTTEIGVKCPVFLFFSVNGSGQFVGVAEMLSQVDFSKNMDFWQLDKWNGFFPVKWHIVKDVPNAILRHIIIESNENKSVTSSRDTQEIGLKQGTEILGIFKNYTERTCVLDDFNFYENREKSLKAKRNGKLAAQTVGFKDGDYVTHFEAAETAQGERPEKTKESDPSSLVSLTQNLSINPHSLKGGNT